MKLRPTDPELYDVVKNAAKEKFRGAWPSVAGSAWLVQQYKSVGGGFFGEKPERSALVQKITSTPSITYWPCKERVQREAAVELPSTRVHLGETGA